MITSQYFNISGTASVFASNRHIASKQHCSVWTKSIANVWSQVQYDNYDLVNNSIVLNTPILSTLAIQAELRVADSQEELGTSPTDISILAGLNTEIELLASKSNELSSIYDNIDGLIDISDNIVKAGIVADNIANVNTVADNIDDIVIVKDNTTNINIVASNKTNIDIAASNIDEIQNASANASIATTKALEASNSATSASTSTSQALTSRNQAETFAQQAQASALSVDANNIVHRTGDESIAGVKTFSSSPIAPTAAVGTNTTQLATTAYVKSEVANETYTKAQVDSKLDAQLVGSIAELKLMDGSTVNKLEVLGYYEKDDGGGGTFYWDSTSTETDNGGTTIQANGIATGRWKRVFSGAVNVKWFGAKGDWDGVTDDTQAFIKASGGYVPSGNYKVTSTVNGYFFTNSTDVVIDKRYINIININKRTAEYKDPSSPCSSLTGKKIVVNLNNDNNDNKLLVITKKNSANGYIGTIIYKDVAPSDANNLGGDSNYRPQGVLNIPIFYSAKIGYISKSSNTILALNSGLVITQVNTMWGYYENGNIPVAVEIGTVPFNFSSRNIWNLTTTNEYIIYKSEQEECDIRFGITNGSSTSVKIQVSIDGTNFVDYSIISLVQTPSGTIGFKDIKVKYNNSYYIKVTNLTASPCYVAGLDFNYSLESTTLNSDCIVYMESPLDVNNIQTVYLANGGANEFAAHKLGGKWFGTYHGGHSDFEEKLKVVVNPIANWTSTAFYDLRLSSIPKFMITNYVELHSHSNLNYDDSSYQYNAETYFGDGVNITNVSIVNRGTDLLLCDTIYTHMCTTQRNFDFIRQPIYIYKNDDGDVVLGNVGFISQYNTVDARQVNCYFSTTDCSKNAFGGARILFAPQYNKQYYGGTVSSTIGEPLATISFKTIKEFL